MQYQEKRGILYIISNAVVSTLYFLYVLMVAQPSLPQRLDDKTNWAIVILAYILLLIVVRIVVVIIFAIVHKIQTNEDTVEIEDELDKLIDLKATRIFYGFFMAGLILSIGSQAIGWPLWVLFAGIGATIAVSGLIGDLVQLIYYRRGV